MSKIKTNKTSSQQQTRAFYQSKQQKQVVGKPLFIGSSGGSGAIMSVEAVRQHLIAHYDYQITDMPLHRPVFAEEKQNTAKNFKLKAAAFVINDIPAISLGIRAGLAATDHPKLPDNKAIQAEVLRLSAGQKNNDGTPKLRYYVDMPLDALALGYQYTAIYNILHVRLETKQLKLMLKRQAQVDKDNHADAKAHILQVLNDARDNGFPFTEVITTQNLCIPAICDAVIEYNRQNKVNLKVHQYLSDIATDGNHHYWSGLNQLKAAQRQVMILYGINLSKIAHKSIKNLTHAPFHRQFDIDPKQNPLVRAGFKDSKRLERFLNKPGKKVKLKIQVANAADKAYEVGPNEKVASIMLGSLAGDDTIGYAMELAKLYRSRKCIYDKIFVFGGNNPRIKDKLTRQIEQLAKRQRILGIKGPTVILLDNQDDVHSAPIRVRSDLTILRGGGLSTMEEMAMPHHPDQEIYYHANRDGKGQFTTGVVWEDANIAFFREYMGQTVKKIEMTSVHEIEHELVRRYSMNRFINSILTFGRIEKVPDENFCSELLEELVQKTNYYLSLPQDKEVRRFVDSLNALHADLHMDYLTMKAKGRSDRNMMKASSMVIAKKTIDLLTGLQENAVKEDDNDQTKEAKRANSMRLIKRYEKSVSKISGIAAFGKAVAVVILGAIGVVLGAVIGSAIGFFLGSWSGPGAIVSSVAGLFQGVYSGAALGLVVGTAATGVATSSIAAGLFFKPDKRAKDVKRVAEMAKEYNSMKITP